jgi:hypothetical protein
MDVLVSTGNKFPYTILEINFFNQKIFCNYFINIFYFAVDKHDEKWSCLTNNLIDRKNLLSTCLKKYFIAFVETLDSKGFH